MATALAGAMTLGLGTVCLAAVGGAPMLGMAAAKEVTSAGVTEVQVIDRVVVIRSSTTVAAGETPVVQLVAPDGTPIEPQPAAPLPGAPQPAAAQPGAPQTAAQPTAAQPAASEPAGPPAPASAAPATPAATEPSTATTAKPSGTTATTAAPVTTAKAVATTAAPTTAKPVVTTVAPTTTKPATTTTVRPPGVPKDWPAGKPIPPMPANCKDPQLELNGVWNCDN